MMVNYQVNARMLRDLHGPDWRWQLALSRVAASVAPSKMDDPYLCAALKFLRQRAGGVAAKAGAARKNQHVAVAERLARYDQEIGYLKVLVLAGCSPEEISKRLAVNLKVITTWEKLFFDVREVPEEFNWMLLKVISPIQERGDTRLAIKLKFAYAGGPLAAQALLQECRLPWKQGARIFDGHIALNLEYAKAQTPLQAPSCYVSSVKGWLKLRGKEQRLCKAKKQLEEMCENALRREGKGEQMLEPLLQSKKERDAKACKSKTRAKRKSKSGLLGGYAEIIRGEAERSVAGSEPADGNQLRQEVVPIATKRSELAYSETAA